MTFIFRNKTIFWDILKWNRGQKKWDGESIFFFFLSPYFGLPKAEFLALSLGGLILKWDLSKSNFVLIRNACP